MLLYFSVDNKAYITDCTSMTLFPVGWCETNGYTLTKPAKTTKSER